MNYQSVIEYKLHMLINLILTDGVSPADLSNNIFETDYIEISFSKKNEYVIGKLSFYENGNILNNIQMFYTYSKDKQLIRIEEMECGIKKLLWDRKKREEELIEEMLYFMSLCYSNEQIRDFIFSLPSNLQAKVENYIASLSA